jgi:tRNA nucleotidyltransferase (CCA-adding enzyme)
MANFDLLKFILPGLKFDKRLINLLSETQKAITWYKLLYLDEPFKQWRVYLFAITARAKMKELVMFCERFELADRYKTKFLKEKEEADKILASLSRKPRLRASEIYWLLQERSHETLLYIIAMARRKSAKKAVSNYVTHLRHVTTYTTGADLKEMGYATGPLFRSILNHLLEAKLDGQVKSRSDEIQFVRRHYPTV